MTLNDIIMHSIEVHLACFADSLLIVTIDLLMVHHTDGASIALFCPTSAGTKPHL